jgi:hypothetical protein
MRGLATDLRERRERRAESYQTFVEALARWLVENLLPRCVVVHNYAELAVTPQSPCRDGGGTCSSTSEEWIGLK